jgi:N6-L-threonylcarbamoyladenine synthase
LNLPYPGGPLIDKYAQQGNVNAFQFPEPQISGLNFSFSGLKTAILYFVRNMQKEEPDFLDKNMADVCASVQNRIVTILLRKLKRAAKEYNIKDIAIAGGVSANSGLRTMLVEYAEANGWRVFIPRFEYCTDNAAMIAVAGYYKYLKQDFVGQDITPMARMRF